MALFNRWPVAKSHYHVDMLKKQQTSGQFTDPALRTMAATAVTAGLHRIYDGKLQGLHLLVNLGAPGSRSPWVQEATRTR